MENNTYPLHLAQRDVWADQLINRESPHYNVGGYIRLYGCLNKQLLKAAVDSVPDVFDVFRMRFNLNSEQPEFYTITGDCGYKLTELDLSKHNDPAQSAQAWMQSRFDTPFIIDSTTPAFELCLIKISDNEYFFFNRYHHLITDGYGFAVWAQYIARKYNSLLNGDTTPFTYPQYLPEVVNSSAYYKGPQYEQEAGYWKEKIKEKPQPFLQKKYAGQQSGPTSGKYTLTIPAEMRSLLKTLEKDTRSVLPNLTIAALLIYFSKTTGITDFIFGLPLHKRRSRTARSVVGMFSGILPCKGSYQPNITLAGFLAQIAASAKNDYRNQNYLLSDLNRHLKNNAATGIIEVIINYELLNFELDFGTALQAETFELTCNYSRYPLQLWWRDYGPQQSLQLSFDYNKEYFSAEEIAWLSRRLLHILMQFPGSLHKPVSSIDILPEEEKQYLLPVKERQWQELLTEKTIVHLWDEQVRKTPEQVAVVFEQQHLTYRELDHRTTQLAGFLQGKGIGAEDLVAVCMNRSLEMIVAIVGILKAGAAYVPIDPEYPNDRINYILNDTAASLVISHSACYSKIEPQPGIEVLLLDGDREQINGYAGSAPLIKPLPSQAMYVIYTSGSTGRPKGVVVEHRGLLNRLLWGQDLFKLQNDDAVLQKTTYCFDVSVWELLWPLVTGARLVFTRPNGQKDTVYLKALIDAEKITTIHFVPAMLETFLAAIMPGDCLSLRRVICSGEALKSLQVQLCQEKLPHVQLYNLYGPTEASIEVTRWALTGSWLPADGVPIGEPVPNTPIYILNEQSALSPIETAGEIHIGGVQVARGYLNQPELTSNCFVKDPFRNEGGARMYRTGDLARWQADGSIAYMGRKDDQVKIRGFRIEPGEIENVMVQSGLVTQSVVLVREDGQGNKRLYGYVVPTGTFDKDALVANLKSRLPDYMVPSQLIAVAQMPLTGSGKIDKKALAAILAHEAAGRQGYTAPRTVQEEQLVHIWQELLQVEQVGVHDNFFELGGDSIIAIQTISRTRRAGYASLQINDLYKFQTIAQLSKWLEVNASAAAVMAEQGALQGNSGLLPIQQYYFSRRPTTISWFNQSVLLGLDKTITEFQLQEALSALLRQHDALRLVYRLTNQDWVQEYSHEVMSEVIVEELSDIQEESLAAVIEKKATDYQRSLQIEKGELVRMVLFKTAAQHNRLLIVIHHLVVDGVSWRILLEDLDLLLAGHTLTGKKSSSYRQWYQALVTYSQSRRLQQQRPYWEAMVQQYQPLPVDRGEGTAVIKKEMGRCAVRLSESATRALVQEVPRVYHTEINDILLSALALTLEAWRGSTGVIIGLEGHGREEIGAAVDTSRTVGWFTSLYPVLLHTGGHSAGGAVIKAIKEQLRRVPDKGIGFGVLKYIVKEESLQGPSPWDIVFNYLGRADNVLGGSGSLVEVESSAGESTSGEYELEEKLSVNAMVAGGELVMQWSYSSRHYERETIEQIALKYLQHLEALIAHCLEQGTKGVEYTPSDYGLGNEVSYEELDTFLSDRKEKVQGLYRLSGLQEGMLFHGLYDARSEAYTEQLSCTLTNVHMEAFRESWQHLLQRHSILRSGFYYDVFRIPVQCVYRQVELPIEILDYRERTDLDQQQAIQVFAEAERRRGFDFSAAPLMRIALLRLDEQRCRMIWTHHHILLDGWSLPVLMEELLQTYEGLLAGSQPVQVEEDRYEDYIRYIERRDKEQEEKFWKGYLQGLEAGVLLPFASSNFSERNKGIGVYEHCTLTLDKTATAALVKYAQRHRVTVNTVMQAVWAYLLYRYTGQSNIVYGVTVSGRPEDLPGVEKRVGIYINALPLHTTIQEDRSIAQWLTDIQTGHAASRAWQYTPLPEIQQWSGVQGELFDSLLVFENYPVSKVLAANNWSLKPAEVQMEEHSNYAISISVMASEEETQVRFQYNTAILEAQAVQRISNHFEQALHQITNLLPAAACIKDIRLLTGQEVATLLAWGGNQSLIASPANGHKEFSLWNRFAERITASPNARAVVFGGVEWSYEKLGIITNQLSWYFTQVQLSKGDRVIVLIDRSEWMLLLLLSLLKSGLVYVPVDADYPPERINFIIEDIGPALIITEKQLAGITATAAAKVVLLESLQAALNHCSPVSAPATVGPDEEAYIIYTSGSTGKPKGVVVTHRNLDHFLTHVAHAYQGERPLSMPFVASNAFDISLFQLLTPIMQGGTCIIVNKEQLQDIDKLVSVIQQVTAIDTVPALYSLIVGYLEANDLAFTCGHIERLFIGGDAIPDELLYKLSKVFRNARITVTYGPTEGTIFCTHITYNQVIKTTIGQGAIIGQPVPGTAVYLLDKNLELVPAGVEGELCIGGAGVSKGYFRQPELTSQKYVNNPYAPGYIYRTGDAARWTQSGLLEFRGRKDEQVKIRGFRIELTEIESVLQKCEGVREALVLANEDANKNKRLVAYVLPAPHFDKAKAVDWLKSRLPEYMVPALLITLEKIPLSANGKVDKKALQQIAAEESLSNTYVAPRNNLELEVTAIWQELLGIQRIGITDNFFELGGHSLLATRLVAAIYRSFGVKLSIRLLFQIPTIELISKYIRVNRSTSPVETTSYKEIKL